MRTWADSTLMSMKKSDLIERLRCAEHNQAVAEERLAQHIENVKEWAPVVRCKYSYENIDGLTCVYGPCVDCTVPEDFYCKYGEREEE